MSLTIRQASETDVPSVVEAIKQLAMHVGELSPVDETFVVSYLSKPGNGVLVAEDGGTFAGLLSYTVRLNLYHAGPVYSIDELFVLSRWRGQGIGRALITTLLDMAVANGGKEVSVSTLFENEAAINFYDALGFGDRALLLERHLC